MTNFWFTSFVGDGLNEKNEMQVTRVNSTNVQDEGLRIRGIGRRMNSKVNQSNKVCIESKRGG
jgi:hypothetical protein